MKKYQKICEGCKKEFIARRKDKKYCTPRCYFFYWKIRKES